MLSFKGAPRGVCTAGIGAGKLGMDSGHLYAAGKPGSWRAAMITHLPTDPSCSTLL
jgi:hypothetical protein